MVLGEDRFAPHGVGIVWFWFGQELQSGRVGRDGVWVGLVAMEMDFTNPPYPGPFPPPDGRRGRSPFVSFVCFVVENKLASARCPSGFGFGSVLLAVSAYREPTGATGLLDWQSK